MISRNGTVNISNMPVASEEPYDPEWKAEHGSWVVKRFASLVQPSDWKITKFVTTLPVRIYSVYLAPVS